MGQVIVLNADFQILSTVPLKKAWKYIALGKVKILKEINNVPKVIQFIKIVVAMHRKGVPWNKHNVHLRDRYKCAYCGERLDKKELTIDHIIPQDRGGKSTWENTTTSCFPCNNKKQNRTPSEANMAFIKRGWKPYAPTVMEFYMIKFAEDGIEETLNDLGIFN